ncbi:MAG TPA: hypothetical protein VHD95_10635 [Rhizomicrobium sp.]|nr:hypothetical protein [Rhizomicrobium sp.]
MNVFSARSRTLAAIAAIGVLLGATGVAYADASSAQYRGCDGYGAASGEGDGMTEIASVLLIFNPIGYGNTGKSSTSVGEDGVADCDAALADLPEKHWMRKFSLLRARAMHRLENYDALGALEDVDLAAAVAKGHDDAYFARSLGLGLDIVRAYALRINAKQHDAETVAMQAAGARPYSRQVQLSALIAMGPGVDPADADTVRRAIARLVPTEVDALFLDAFDSGRFAEALALYPQLAPPEEIGNINLSSSERAEREWRDFENAQEFWAWRGGANAYALAALGRNAEARVSLDAARSRLALTTQPPPPLSAADEKDTEAQALHRGAIDIRLQAAAQAGKILDEWSSMVERRIMVSDGKLKEVMATLQTQPLVHSFAAVDLLESIIAKLPEKERPANSPTKAMREKLAKERVEALQVQPSALFKSLPEPETASRIPPYEEASTPLLAMEGSRADIDTEGYRISDPDAQGIVTVSYRGIRAGDSTVEEMALLCAADVARKAGKKGMIVLHRMDVRYTVTTETGYMVPVRKDPDGYQTELKVVFVDPAALPRQYVDAAWRVIDTDALYAALSPFYIRPAKHN